MFLFKFNNCARHRKNQSLKAFLLEHQQNLDIQHLLPNTNEEKLFEIIIYRNLKDSKWINEISNLKKLKFDFQKQTDFKLIKIEFEFVKQVIDRGVKGNGDLFFLF